MSALLNLAPHMWDGRNVCIAPSDAYPYGLGMGTTAAITFAQHYIRLPVVDGDMIQQVLNEANDAQQLLEDQHCPGHHCVMSPEQVYRHVRGFDSCATPQWIETYRKWDRRKKFSFLVGMNHEPTLQQMDQVWWLAFERNAPVCAVITCNGHTHCLFPNDRTAPTTNLIKFDSQLDRTVETNTVSLTNYARALMQEIESRPSRRNWESIDTVNQLRVPLVDINVHYAWGHEKDLTEWYKTPLQARKDDGGPRWYKSVEVAGLADTMENIAAGLHFSDMFVE